MSELTLILLNVVAAVIVLLFMVRRPLQMAVEQAHLVRAKAEFHRRREGLEAQFCQVAPGRNLQAGLKWTDCKFADEVTYARDRQTNGLSAFVAIEVAFQPERRRRVTLDDTGSDVRSATAVFRVTRGHWTTSGVAIFSMNPAEAIAYYRDSMELVSQEPTSRG
ncbi:MAG: hypothetical protein ACYC35_21775 [Pirellulales bacterium]